MVLNDLKEKTENGKKKLFMNDNHFCTGFKNLSFVQMSFYPTILQNCTHLSGTFLEFCFITKWYE